MYANGPMQWREESVMFYQETEWVPLIVNVLLMLLQWDVIHVWSFSDLAVIVRIKLMYYIDVMGFHEQADNEWKMAWKRLHVADLRGITGQGIWKWCGILGLLVTRLSQSEKSCLADSSNNNWNPKYEPLYVKRYGWWCEWSEHKSRKKITLFSSYSIVPVR